MITSNDQRFMKRFAVEFMAAFPELEGIHEGHRLMFDYLSRSV